MKFLMFALGLALCAAVHAAEPPPAPTLDTLRSGHPRLFFTPEAEAALRRRAASDPLVARLIAKTRQRSDDLAALPPVPFASTPSAEFGIVMLDVSRAVLERVVVHGFMYRYTGKASYAQRLRREVEAALAYPTWNPAHFLDAAEMLLAMGFAYDWAYDAWTPEQRKALREAMKSRAIARGLEIHETHARQTSLSSFFPTTTSNWNPVSNTGLLAASLAMAEDEPELARRVIGHVLPSLNHPKQDFVSGAAYGEGQSYWAYSTDFFMLASQLLHSALGSDGGLADEPQFARGTLFRLHVRAPSGRNYTYADSWPASDSHLGYAVLASRYGPALARADVRRMFADYLGGQFEQTTGHRLYPLAYLLLPPPEPQPVRPLPLDAFFTDTVHLSMMRSSWHDPNGAYLGFKAGQVEHSHNHLDAGSFVFDHGGVRWSTDLGPESYSVPGYFRKETNVALPLNEGSRHLPNRWLYFRANNHGHSTLTLGGALQARDAVAPFVATGSRPAFSYSVADLSSVYPAQASQWRRGVALVDRRWMIVRDELKGLPRDLRAEWVMMSEAEVEVAADGRSAELSRDGRRLRLTLAEAPPDARIEARPATPPSRLESQNEGITRITVSWTAQQADQVLEAHLVPAGVRPGRRGAGPLATWPAARR